MPEQRRERQAVAHLAGPRRRPTSASRLSHSTRSDLGPVGRLAHMGGAVGAEEVERAGRSGRCSGGRCTRWVSGPGRQPVSSSVSRAAASAGVSPASTRPAGTSQPQVSVMKRWRQSEQHARGRGRPPPCRWRRRRPARRGARTARRPGSPRRSAPGSSRGSRRAGARRGRSISRGPDPRWQPSKHDCRAGAHRTGPVHLARRGAPAHRRPSARRCGVVTFPKQGSCPRCNGQEIEPELLARRGTLWTWTIQGFLPEEPALRRAGDGQGLPGLRRRLRRAARRR